MKATDLDTKEVSGRCTETRYILNSKVFELDDCPAWAQWAAVDASGVSCWYEAPPEIDGCIWISKCRIRLIKDGNKVLIFNAANWQHSCIKRSDQQ